MKALATKALVLLVMGCAASLSFAGPPVPGNYKTTDIGGPVSTGRYTEGWLPGGGALLAGTTLDAESWNGSSLGTEWRYSCATELAPAVLLVDNVDANGDGNRTYMCTFSGGQIWLSGAGPWANGDASYPGTILSYIEFETVTYSHWVGVSAVTNVQATARFDNYPAACMAFTVSNGYRVGTTDLGMVKPADYPSFYAAGTCAPGLTLGAWWNMITMTLSVYSGCETPARTSTWGSVKARYR
jgi:hypothetical protein